MNPLLAFIERHQRAKRFRRMLSVSPELREAQQRLEKGRREHKPSKPHKRAMSNALHDMLRRATHG